ncbi:hypothetical protein D3C78_1438670 [compost metagenome]
MEARPTDSRIMLKEVPSQILAMTTAQSEKFASERQKILPDTRPLSRRKKFKTPKSPERIQFQMAPTTRPGMTQETRNRPRSQVAPGKFTQKNSARPKPIANCPAIEATTKVTVLKRIGNVSGCRNRSI